MFCSVIIPTIGRASLKCAVESVLTQCLVDWEFEIIIVNDSGSEISLEDCGGANRITLINTQKRERNFARNSGAAIAKGDYLWFLDDDDWILPGAINAFKDLVNANPNAIWLYGGLQIVNEKDEVLAEVNSQLSGRCFAQIMGGAWAPIQTSILSTKAFFELGGFNPDIIGTEDLDLCRRFAYLGEFANTGQNVACLLRGQSWQTSTNYGRAPEDTIRSRDDVLSEPAAFTRLVKSARTSYWYGRILRIYLSTVGWNIRHFRLFTAISRIFYSCFVAIWANVHLFSRKFWSGLSAEHVPGTLHFVMQEYERRIEK